MQPFTEAQAELFFGRSAEIRELTALIAEMGEGGTRRWLQLEWQYPFTGWTPGSGVPLAFADDG